MDPTQSRLEKLRSLLPRQNRLLDLVVLMLLSLLALIPRVYRLDLVPPGLNGDELFNAFDALSIGSDNLPVFFEGNNGREAIFLYLMAGTLRLLGQNFWGIRLPAVLLGTGSVLLTYMLGKLLFKRRVGILAALLIAVSLWPVMQSRWGLRAVSLTFFTALAIYLYSRAQRSDKRTICLWIGSGIALGLTLYTYIPARVFPAVVLVWFGWIWMTNGSKLSRQWRLFLLSILAAMIAFAPFGLYMIQNPDKINQRVSGLTTSLEKARAGEPEAITNSIQSVMFMFTVSGDTAGRYHYDSRPVFDPITGLLFYVGLAVALWRAFRARRRSGTQSDYALILLWMGAMLSPNLLLDADTSFLRAAGAIVPVYLLAAIGFEELFQRLIRLRPERASLMRVVSFLLLFLLLCLTFADTWQAYFRGWVNDPEARAAYHADLAEMSRFLDRLPAAPDGPVFIAYDYVLDATPRSFPYYSDRQVFWFNHSDTLAWRPGVEETWFLVSASKPLSNQFDTLLSARAEPQPVTFDNGDLAFNLYPIKGNDLTIEPENQTMVRFEDGPELIGFDLGAEPVPGENIAVSTHWRIPDGTENLPNQQLFAEVLLEDESGNIWTRSDTLLGYPQNNWRSGDRFIQQHLIQIPEGMPPGSAYFRFGLFDSGGQQRQILAGSNERAGPFLMRVKPVVEPVTSPDMLIFDDILALESHGFSTLLVPGLAVDIRLNWLVLEQPHEDYRVQLGLARSPEGESFFEQSFEIWPDVYPPTQWVRGERVTTLHRLEIPADLAVQDKPFLTLQLLPEDGEDPLAVSQGDSALAEMQPVLREHHFALPEIGNPLDARFGEEIRLLGYDLDATEVRSGTELQLTLYWQAITTPGKGYTVFNHVLGADGQIWGQFDSPPVGDAWLTTSWLPGEIIEERRTIPIREDAPAGEYRLLVGLYTVGDGLRAPVFLDGERQPDDQLELSGLTILP